MNLSTVKWAQWDKTQPIRHKAGYFGDVPQANVLAWCRKTKPNTTKVHIHQSKGMYHNTKYTQKLTPGLVASYDIQPEI